MIKIFNKPAAVDASPSGSSPSVGQQDRDARAAEHQHEGAHQLGGEDAAVVLWFHAANHIP